jgi:hypothetical protein
LFWILENIGFWFELELELFCKNLKETNLRAEKEKGQNKKWVGHQ